MLSSYSNCVELATRRSDASSSSHDAAGAISHLRIYEIRVVVTIIIVFAVEAEPTCCFESILLGLVPFDDHLTLLTGLDSQLHFFVVVAEQNLRWLAQFVRREIFSACSIGGLTRGSPISPLLLLGRGQVALALISS